MPDDTAAQVTLAAPTPAASDDVFRRRYKTPTPETIDAIDAIKGKADELLALIEKVPDPRSQTTAKTNLQQAIFWATHGLTA